MRALQPARAAGRRPRSQVHGIAIAGVVAVIVILAIVGRLALAGIGPFTATVAQVVPDGAGLAITLTVTNEGSSAGPDDLPRHRSRRTAAAAGRRSC